MIPFLRLGEYVSGGPHFTLTSDALKKVLTGNASWEVLLSIYHAVSKQVPSFEASFPHSLSHVSIIF